MKKILYCASVASHLRNFHRPYIKWFSMNECMVDTLTADYLDMEGIHASLLVPFTKSLFSLKNISALFAVRRIVQDGRYDLIITNTTLARIIVRFAIKLLPNGIRPKVFNICHGFLFSQRDGLKKIIYLFLERVCALPDDVFAVMNNANYEMVRDGKLGRVVFTHGMGIDITRFSIQPIPHEGFRFIYAAEFSKRKNQAELLAAFAKAADKMPEARLVLAGDGDNLMKCVALAKSLGITNSVDFPGYISDMPKLLQSCDCAVSTSKHEGLPFNILEAMASGLPIIASDIEGHMDLLSKENLYNDDLADKLLDAYHQGKQRTTYPQLTRYTLDNVMPEWKALWTFD